MATSVVVRASEPETVLGAQAAFDFSAAPGETIVVDPGTALYQEATGLAPVLYWIDTEAELLVLERRAEWTHVRYEDMAGWIWSGTGPMPSPGALPPQPDRAVTRPATDGTVDAMDRRPSTPPGADPDRVAALVERLGPDRQSLEAGLYTLWTNVTEPALNARMARVAGAVDAVFTSRYGVEPRPPKGEVIVVFANAADYQAEAERQTTLKGISSRGHAGNGLALLTADGPKRHTDAILIHEVTHLVARRALGRSLPPWLEEGLAEDLAYAHVDRDGVIDVQRVGRFPHQREAVLAEGLARIQTRRVGAGVAFDTIRKAFETATVPTLQQLLDDSFDEFMRSDDRDLHYALAAHFVRYVGDDEALRPHWFGFLENVAFGGPVDGESLLEHLGQTWPTLQDGFHTFLDDRPQ